VTAKRYDGYRSFQYLKEGADYRAFALAKDVGRVTAHDIPLDADEERRSMGTRTSRRSSAGT